MVKLTPTSLAERASRAISGRKKEPTKNCEVPAWGCLLTLLGQNLDEQVIYPRYYLGASLELFAFTIVLSFAVTLAVDPKQVWEHPLRNSVGGAVNPCFGWDFPPMSYVSQLILTLNVYLACRYAWLEAARNRMVCTRKGKRNFSDYFSLVTGYFYAFANFLFLLIWVLAAQKYWKFHTMIFMLFAVAGYMACLGNYLEVANGPHKYQIQPKHTIYLVVYGVATLGIPVVYGALISGIRFPLIVPQMTDAVWMLCTFSTLWGTPPEPPLKMTCELVSSDDEIKLMA
jgi:hypothetical protein